MQSVALGEPIYTGKSYHIPKWKRVYLYTRDLPVGTVISFDEFAQAGINIEKNRSAIYYANKRLLLDYNRMLISVRNEGYKIAYPVEHLASVEKRPIKASNQLNLGLLEGQNIDYNKLTNEEKIRLTFLINKIALSLKYVNRKQNEAIIAQEEAKAAQAEALDRLAAIEQELAILKESIKK